MLVCTLAKEVRLQHGAPVVFIQVVDANGYPIPAPREVTAGKAKAPKTDGTSQVLIASEEQFKLFNLPTLKPAKKAKLTAHDGGRARRVAIGQFVSKADDKAVEHCILYLSNQGEAAVYGISDLKRQLSAPAIRKEDVHGISSLVYSKAGEGLYLHSPSEFRRFSLSARRNLAATGIVEIAEGVRPVKQSEVRPPIAAASLEPVAEVAEPVDEVETKTETVKETTPAPEADKKESKKSSPSKESKKSPAKESKKSPAKETKKSSPPKEVVEKPEASAPVDVQVVETVAVVESNVTVITEAVHAKVEEKVSIESEDPCIVAATLPAELAAPVEIVTTVIEETTTLVTETKTNGHAPTANGTSHVNGTNGAANGSSGTDLEEAEDDGDKEVTNNGNDHGDEDGQGGLKRGKGSDHGGLITGDESLDISNLTIESSQLDMTIDSVKDHLT